MKIIAKLYSILLKILPRPHLSDSQYLYIASAVKTFADAILIGSTAAFFLPETLQLTRPILLNRFVQFFITGLIILALGAILERRGKHD